MSTRQECTVEVAHYDCKHGEKPSRSLQRCEPHADTIEMCQKLKVEEIFKDHPCPECRVPEEEGQSSAERSAAAEEGSKETVTEPKQGAGQKEEANDNLADQPKASDETAKQSRQAEEA